MTSTWTPVSDRPARSRVPSPDDAPPVPTGGEDDCRAPDAVSPRPVTDAFVVRRPDTARRPDAPSTGSCAEVRPGESGRRLGAVPEAAPAVPSVDLDPGVHPAAVTLRIGPAEVL